MTDLEAINAICGAGVLSAEGLNYLHACRPGHPLNNRHQWVNAQAAVSGRHFSGLWPELRHIAMRARQEQAAA